LKIGQHPLVLTEGDSKLKNNSKYNFKYNFKQSDQMKKTPKLLKK